MDRLAADGGGIHLKYRTCHAATARAMPVRVAHASAVFLRCAAGEGSASHEVSPRAMLIGMGLIIARSAQHAQRRWSCAVCGYTMHGPDAR